MNPKSWSIYTTTHLPYWHQQKKQAGAERNRKTRRTTSSSRVTSSHEAHQRTDPGSRLLGRKCECRLRDGRARGDPPRRAILCGRGKY